MCTRRFISLGLVLLIAATLPACFGTRRCQINNQVFSTFVGQEWRMVSSSNPSLSGILNPWTFLIVGLGLDYTGTVHRVENNARFNTPTSLLTYNVDPESRVLVIQYETVIGETEDGGYETQPDGTVQYHYELGTELRLTEVSTGYTYRLVPFTGVVNPDDFCTF